MPEWTAEVTVDEELARRLIGEQFPQLEARTVRRLAEGWDNAVWVVDETWAFRFPRREIAVPLVERELAVLPRLAPRLPLPIPTPELQGQPSDAFPWPFLGSRFLRGSELGSVALSGDGELAIAHSLGGFLRELHSPAVAAMTSDLPLPDDPNRRTDMAVRVPRARGTLAQVEEQGLWQAPPSVERVLESAVELPAAPTVAIVHGDLHFRHLLVEHGDVTGVIDWGDVCRADPSLDLQLYWSFLSPHARDAFLAAYGVPTEDQLLRARVLALFLCAALALYGSDQALPEVERAALAGLERASAG